MSGQRMELLPYPTQLNGKVNASKSHKPNKDALFNSLCALVANDIKHVPKGHHIINRGNVPLFAGHPLYYNNTIVSKRRRQIAYLMLSV